MHLYVCVHIYPIYVYVYIYIYTQHKGTQAEVLIRLPIEESQVATDSMSLMATEAGVVCSKREDCVNTTTSVPVEASMGTITAYAGSGRCEALEVRGQ